ncbi:unnamed protein product [marine sediment metagenome]|uniref:Uncharacterized protein n=1 Tax=marine sediment metagenome TaxID=412755 RepID=X1D2X5_9ZZZZ
MGNDWYQDIVDFHKDVMKDNFRKFPHTPDYMHQRLRRNLIKEEIQETLNAIRQNDLVALADGIADSIVVLLGTAVTYGIDMRPIWDIVHESNMAKADGKLRGDGKMMKPEGWQLPDIKLEIDRQIRR